MSSSGEFSDFEEGEDIRVNRKTFGDAKRRGATGNDVNAEDSSIVSENFERNDTEEEKPPPTTADVAREAFSRILTGMGIIGNGLRSGFVVTFDKVKEGAYPIKEKCVAGYDSLARYCFPATPHEGAARRFGNQAPASLDMSQPAPSFDDEAAF